MNTYSVYIICKNNDIFYEKKKLLMNSNNIDNIYHIPSVFLQCSENNINLKNKLHTRYNTAHNKIISKLGCIASHKNALLSILNNDTINNIILEEDFVINKDLPLSPPEHDCYLGGWIIPPKISQINKIKIRFDCNIGINNINYDLFKIIMTHSYFIKNTSSAKKILIDMIIKEKIKNYDIYLSDNKYIKYFYWPEIFRQSNHISDIDKKINKNSKMSINYGL
jgi:hypothetical protein